MDPVILTLPQGAQPPAEPKPQRDDARRIDASLLIVGVTVGLIAALALAILLVLKRQRSSQAASFSTALASSISKQLQVSGQTELLLDECVHAVLVEWPTSSYHVHVEPLYLWGIVLAVATLGPFTR